MFLVPKTQRESHLKSVCDNKFNIRLRAVFNILRQPNSIVNFNERFPASLLLLPFLDWIGCTVSVCVCVHKHLKRALKKSINEENIHRIAPRARVHTDCVEIRWQNRRSLSIVRVSVDCRVVFQFNIYAWVHVVWIHWQLCKGMPVCMCDTKQCRCCLVCRLHCFVASYTEAENIRLIFWHNFACLFHAKLRNKIQIE